MAWIIGLENPNKPSSIQQQVTPFLGVAKDAKFIDKLYKLIIAIGEAVIYWGPAAITLQVHNIVRGCKDTRLYISLLNVFTGALPLFWTSCKNGAALIGHWWRGTERFNASGGSADKPSMDAVEGGVDQALLGVSILGRLVGGGTFITAFGLSRPIIWFEKTIGSVGKFKHSIGTAFPIIMCVNHIGTVIASVAEYIRAGIIYRRESHNCTKPERDGLYKNYYSMVDKSVSEFVEKVPETYLDISKFVNAAPPITLGLGLAVGILGMWNVCRKVK